MKVLKYILIVLAIIIIILLLGILIFRINWHFTLREKLLTKLDTQFQKNRNNKASIILIENSSASDQHLVTNAMQKEEKFYLASISKLYTHALIFRLVDEGRMNLDETISSYLPKEEWEGILQKNGEDYSQKIKVSDLINQTSGLADYEMDFKGKDSIVDRLRKEDFSITPADAISLTRLLEAKHLPDDHKAHYSNLNAILLGRIAEEVTQKRLETLYQEYIFTPLNCENTEVISLKTQSTEAFIGDKAASRVKYVSSAIACGGLSSNAEELLRFLKAFHQGELFQKSHIENPEWKAIQFFPLQYGAGMMSVEMSPLMSPLFDASQIIGHSGLSGSFAYYYAKKDLYIVGTLNEYESNPYSWVYQYLNAMK